MIEFHLLREWIKSIVLETSVSWKKNGYSFCVLPEEIKPDEKVDTREIGDVQAYVSD